MIQLHFTLPLRDSTTLYHGSKVGTNGIMWVVRVREVLYIDIFSYILGYTVHHNILALCIYLKVGITGIVVYL